MPGKFTRVGLDQIGFDACTASEEVNVSIDRDRKDAGLSGARATPFFHLIAQMFRGIQPIEEFVRVIDHQLGDTKPADLRGEVRISGGIQSTTSTRTGLNSTYRMA